jgi:transcription elongation factor Elf1
MATMIVRTMPRDCTCSVCKQPTRNACTITVKGRPKAASFACDACIARLPYTIKRI